MENTNWPAMVIGMIVCILSLSNIVSTAVGAGGLAVLIYGMFSKWE